MLKVRINILIVFLIVFANLINAQKLIINEISQGTGTREYVEFVVVGTPCESCVDLRKVIIDDNNGYFSTGTNMGVANGAMRFANISFWECVPKGTIIVVYNNGSPNQNLPMDDQDLNDGNNQLVLPASSNLLESTPQPYLPSSNDQTYPLTGVWDAGGNWDLVVMQNSDDSFQVRDSNGVLIHSVSWNENNMNTFVYFSNSAAGKVFSFTNTNSNNYNLSANWESTLVSDNTETPASPNSNANQIWIDSLLNAPNNGLEFTTNTNNACQNLCNGSSSVNLITGLSPINYLWLDNSNFPISNTLSASDLCAGTYLVIVSTGNGCVDTQTVIISNVQQNANLVPAGPFFDYQTPQQLNGSPSGGQWTSTCGNCLDNQGIFNPQVANEGVFDLCYIVGTGVCSDTSCTSIEVIHCDPINETIPLCEGDSVLVFSQWIDQSQTVTQQEQTIENCIYTHTVTIVVSDCISDSVFVFVPNVFTPNGELFNDTFQVETQGGIVEDGYIVNRWGDIIHAFNQSNVFWDGKDDKSNLPVQDGVYTYLIYFKPTNAPRVVYHGFVTVVR